MKICHFVRFGRHTSGLYETTQEIAAGQRKYLDWDARIYDVRDLKDNPHRTGDDRGVPFADDQWAMKEADAYFLHTVIPEPMRGLRPVFYLAHGLPEDIFYSQITHTVAVDPKVREERGKMTPFMGTWIAQTTLGQRDWCKAAITLWRRHVAYLEPYFQKVVLANHFCDLEAFKPEGKQIEYYARPAAPGGLNITFADHWRYTTRKDPFQIIHGLRKFCIRTGSKLHLYALPKDEILNTGHPWNSVIHATTSHLQQVLGSIYTIHDDIGSVHRKADLLITPSCDDTRTVLEATACGCPVLAREGTEGASWHCRIEDPDDVDRVMTKIQQEILADRQGVRAKARKIAEDKKFSLERSVKTMAVAIEAAVKEDREKRLAPKPAPKPEGSKLEAPKPEAPKIEEPKAEPTKPAETNTSGEKTIFTAANDASYEEMLVPFIGSLRENASFDGRLVVLDYGLSQQRVKKLTEEGIAIVPGEKKYDMMVDRFHTIDKYIKAQNITGLVAHFDSDIWFLRDIKDVFAKADGVARCCKDVWTCTFLFNCVASGKDGVKKLLKSVIDRYGNVLQAGFICGDAKFWGDYNTLQEELISKGFVKNAYGTDALALNIMAFKDEKRFDLLPVSYNCLPQWGIKETGNGEYFATDFHTDTKPPKGILPVHAIHVSRSVRNDPNFQFSFKKVQPEKHEKWLKRLSCE